MDLTLLETTMSDRGEPAYRTRQVWEWAARGATGYDAMTNVPTRLRDALGEAVPFSTLDGRPASGGAGRDREDALPHARRSPGRGGADALPRRSPLDLRLVAVGLPPDVHVLRDRADAVRPQPDASEIVDQALHFRRIEAVDHCVFMGMGEPLLNLDKVLAAAGACRIGITHRRTTISTVGWMPGLTRFVDEVEEPIRLALSLHAADPALRSQLMPVNDRYPLADVLAECRRYVELRGRKVYVEYVMLEGVNDTPRHAAELARGPRPEGVQGEPDPVQPDRSRTAVRRETRSQRSRACSTGPGSRPRYASRVAATSRRRAGNLPRRRSALARRGDASDPPCRFRRVPSAPSSSELPAGARCPRLVELEARGELRECLGRGDVFERNLRNGSPVSVRRVDEVEHEVAQQRPSIADAAQEAG